ncbi:hypothetical protein MKEN_00602900 [Mycena kentingensis (nom. inval.)]|nr:hypothetical protein MKEN_00602900 [Mycena kentingensis (nom. inval.)]
MRSVCALSAVLLLATTATAIVTPRQDEQADWKIALGWDGTTLPALAIGTPIGPFTANTSEPQVQPRSGKPGGIFICIDVGWGDPCGYSVQPLNQCILLGSPWLRAVSSFGPDPGATCFAFASGDCNNGNAQWSFKFPGDSTGGLGTSNPWNDKITSFACVPS